MARRPTTIPEIYSQQLLPLGHGYPLWDAELEKIEKGKGPTSQAVFHEVDLGTVGRIVDGKFWLLFDAMKEAGLQPHGAPSEFKPFSPSNLMLQGPWEKIKQPVISSQNVRSHDIQASLSVGVPSLEDFCSAGGGLKFQCTDTAGALLLLETPAVALRIGTKRHVVRYMRDNWDNWLQFVNEECGLELKQEEIFFVHGWVKTTRWACTAFHGHSRNTEGSLQAQVANAGSISLTVSIQNQGAPISEHNHGPTLSREQRRLVASQAEAQQRPDQCVFINYYKAKKRLLWRPRFIAAAAGPHELPPGDRDNAGGNDPVSADSPNRSSDDDFEEMPPSAVPWDPVNYLLDYILANSEARIAIASDTDLYALFQDTPVFPPDVAAALEDLKPTVEVDEEGAGTIVVEHGALIDPAPSATEPAASAPAGGGAHPLDVEFARPAPEVKPSEDEHESDFQRGPSSSRDPEKEAKDAAQRALEEAERRREALQALLHWQAAASGHTGTVTALAYSHDSTLVASGSDDRTIILWNAATQTIIRRWEAHTDVIWALAFSLDGTRLASAGADSNIMVWSVDTDAHLATLHGHAETIHAMEWSSDGKRIASGSDDTTIRIWDADSYQEVSVLEGHNAMVTFVKFSHDNRWLLSGGADYCGRIWDVATGAQHKMLRGHQGMVWHGAFDADDRRVITGADDSSARVWSVETGEVLVELYEHQGPVWNVAFSPDGRQVLTASADSTLKVCDSFTGKRQFALLGHESMINTACFSPDGKYVASAASDNTVRLWRATDGEAVAIFNEHDDKVMLVIFSPNGDTLASGADDGTVRIRVVNEWDPDRAREAREREEKEEDNDNAGTQLAEELETRLTL